MTEIIYMTREDQRAWKYVPEMLQRIKDFCIKMDTDTDPDYAVDLIRAWFVYPKYDSIAVWIIVKDEKIVAHLLATAEPLGSDRIRNVLIRQAEADEKVDVRKESEEVFQQVLTWAKAIGVNKVNMLTHRNEDAMARRWGFKTYKVLMRRSITIDD